jgi:hypothetical protein
MDPAPALYTIRIHGHLGAAVLSAFPNSPMNRITRMKGRHQERLSRPAFAEPLHEHL